MYNRGDKGGKTHSVNMVSDRVATQMAAFEQLGDDLKENQYKIADALQQLVASSDTTIGGDGGIPPVIEKKSMGTAPTEGNTDFLSMMAQTKGQSTALQAVEKIFILLTLPASILLDRGTQARRKVKVKQDMTNLRLQLFISCLYLLV